jgi:hypothetical protein
MAGVTSDVSALRNVHLEASEIATIARGASGRSLRALSFRVLTRKMLCLLPNRLC